MTTGQLGHATSTSNEAVRDGQAPVRRVRSAHGRAHRGPHAWSRGALARVTLVQTRRPWDTKQSRNSSGAGPRALGPCRSPHRPATITHMSEIRPSREPDSAPETEPQSVVPPASGGGQGPGVEPLHLRPLLPRRQNPWLVVEVDGSPAGHGALVWALREAARREATVVAVDRPGRPGRRSARGLRAACWSGPTSPPTTGSRPRCSAPSPRPASTAAPAPPSWSGRSSRP